MRATRAGEKTDAAIDSLYQSALAKQRRGDLDGAEHSYRAVIDGCPDHAGAWHFLGVIHQRRKHDDTAYGYFERALSLCATNAVFHNNFGVLLNDMNRPKEAQKAFEEALRLEPNYVDARSNLGVTLLRNNNLVAAEREILAALKIAPDHADALKHLGQLRHRQGNRLAVMERFNDANQAFHEAASLPGGKKLWHWKSLGFCPSVFRNEESAERYWQRLHEGLDVALSQNIDMDWRNLPFDGFTPPFNLTHFGKCCREIKEKYYRLFSKAFPQSRPTLEETRKNRTKIRVGFLATVGHHRGFLRVHRHLLEHLDSRRFEVFVLCPHFIVEECRNAVRRGDITWVRLPRDFEGAAKTMRETQCDILYHWKAGGGTLDYFLPFVKAAPIQCVSFGSHGTSGVGDIDYFISTSQLESPSAQVHYTERLVLLDGYATSHEREGKTVATRSELGLPESGAIYFCAQRLPKYQPRFDFYLKRILKKDPTGTLILLTGKHPELKELFSQRLRDCLGDTLFKRVRLVSQLPLQSYKKHIAAATCLLDSPVYAGDLTTHDAFENGVPVVTLRGELLVQRYTSGLCKLMGLESLVANDAEEYSDIAVRLGTDVDYREDICRAIRERNELVFSPNDTLRGYERFFETACCEHET